jgi:hypothetical protein
MLCCRPLLSIKDKNKLFLIKFNMIGSVYHIPI